MKYLFVSTGDLQRLSSFVRLKALGKELASMGIDVFYTYDNTPYNCNLVKSLTYAKCHMIPQSNKNLSFRFSQVICRRKIIKSISPDVIHFLNPSPNNTASVIGFKGAVLVSDWDELLSNRISNIKHRFANLLCEGIARNQADLLTVSSRHLKKHFLSDHNCSSLYLPYATYLDNIEINDAPFAEATAVYMGNLHNDGDHDILIDAWTILEAKGDAPNLWLIGGGPCLEKVKAEVENRRLQKIVIKGYLPIEEMWQALCHAHVLLFPIRNTISNRMRCPSKTFAYMQAGVPIITCNVGEVAEALDSKGIYIEATAKAFATKVHEIFLQPTLHVNYNLSNHSWKSRAETLLKSILSIDK